VPGTHRSGQRTAGRARGSGGVASAGDARDRPRRRPRGHELASLHGGTANRTGRRRLALHAFYCRWDKPQQQYQKALLREETVAALSPAARAMLALDDPANDALSLEGGRTGS
jgi:hypothetical protein